MRVVWQRFSEDFSSGRKCSLAEGFSKAGNLVMHYEEGNRWQGISFWHRAFGELFGSWACGGAESFSLLCDVFRALTKV